jgi:NADP-dependent alcohol dehydrogenase
MFNFNLYAPTKILFGQGQISDLPNQIPQNSRILLTYGGGSVMRNGVLRQVRTALAGFTVFEFAGIEANPEFDTLMKAVEMGRQQQVDFVLAVGGGSVIDGSKFISAAIHYEQDPWEILTSYRDKSLKLAKVLPLGTVLTIPATGSEMNGGSVISRRATGDKLHFTSDLVIPRFSVMDPTVTFSLPEKQTANGIVDAFVHVAEQYLTYPVDAKVQDFLAEGLMKTLISDGPKVLRQPSDYNARANVMWAATMALNGYIGIGVPQDWSTHMIGHEITALYGLDHAQTLAIVLPAMLQARKEHKREKLLQFATNVWGLVDKNEDDRIDKAIEATREFFEKLGVATHLSDYGIEKPDYDALINKLASHGMTALGEHNNIKLSDSREVLVSAS